MADFKNLTTSSGRPVGDNQNVMSVGPKGPLLLQDSWFLEKLAAFDRERIPERVVHARGSGAHGVLEITNDISAYSKAEVFKKGTKTPMFIRFSTVAPESGSADAVRDPRGFAVKFYTTQGTWWGITRRFSLSATHINSLILSTLKSAIHARISKIASGGGTFGVKLQNLCTK